MADVSTDISKMKVADLKRELKNRGKSTAGNKTDLTERLQAALIEGDNTLLDESVLNDDIMDDDELNEELEDHDIDSNHEDAVLKTPPDSIKSKSPEPTNNASTEVNIRKIVTLKRKLNIVVSTDPPSNEVSSTTPLEKTRKFTQVTSPTATTDRTIAVSDTDKTSDDGTDKKVVKLSQLTAKERLELRAKKFGAPIATESLKAARSERFGITPITTAESASDAKTESDTSANAKNGSSLTSNVDILKKRAERFGGSVSKVMNKIENLEKLQKRSERFGGGKTDENKVTVSGVNVTNEEMAEKARLRLERFKTTV